MIEKNIWSSRELKYRLKNLTYSGDENVKYYTRLEPRTRNRDYQKALSFEVFDPLWMLARQWQFGRFKGVDCGSPVVVKIKTTKNKIDQIQRKDSNGNPVFEEYSADVPMEYEVERQNVNVDVDTAPAFIRVESAMQLKKMLLAARLKKSDFAFLYDNFRLEDEREKLKDDVNALKRKKNQALTEYYKFYIGRSFDGCKVYNFFGCKPKDLVKLALGQFVSNEPDREIFADVLVKYGLWFKNKFLPCEGSTNYWSNEKLGYEVKIKQGVNTYVAEDYDSGKLSWHSFDYSSEESSVGKLSKSEIKMLSYVPTPGEIPGAPAARLWEFENRKVNMGNDKNDFSFIGTAAIMQYVTMFSNDWMIVPLETETGYILDVEGIIVKDSFGDHFYIDKNAQKLDGNKKDDIFTDRWDLFGTSFDNAYKDRNFGTSRGLLFPPTVLRCEESKPLEEVQFLRDEMANMVWGVETTIDNRCGGTMDGRLLSDVVLSDVDSANLAKMHSQSDVNEGSENGDEDAEYSLLIQNRVPIHWIPFVPEQMSGDCRNIVLRRARMPVYYKDGYNTIAPSSDLLGYKYKGKRVSPLYINEEEVAGCGIKIVKTAQRTRWFLGKSFNWIGYKEVISEYQANSGLMFDELICKESGKAISLDGGVVDTPVVDNTDT